MDETASSIRIGPIEVGPRENQTWEDLTANSIDDESKRYWTEAGHLTEQTGLQNILEASIKYTVALQKHNSEVPDDSKLRLVIESPTDQTPDEAKNDITERMRYLIEPMSMQTTLGQLQNLHNKINQMIDDMPTVDQGVLDKIKLKR